MANLDQTSKTAEPQGRKASGVDTSSNQDQHKTKLEEAVAAMSLNDGDEATTHPDVKAQSDLSNVAANSPTRNQKSAWLSDPKRLQSPDEDQSFSFEQGESIFPEDSVSRPSSPVLKASTRSAFPYLAHGPRPESRRCSSSPSHRNRGMSIGSDLSERSSTISTAFTGKSHSPSTLRVKRRRQQSSLGMGGAIGLHLGLDAEDDAVQRSEVGQFSNIQQAQRPVSSDSDVD